MNTKIAAFASKALPALSGSPLTYNTARNVFLTMGYTSAAGNSYYKAIRVSNRIAVMYHIGEGYKYTFLNGITLVAWNGRSGEIIAQRFWGGNNWRCFNEKIAKEECVRMLCNYFVGQAKLLGQTVDNSELLCFSRAMIDETESGRLLA